MNLNIKNEKLYLKVVKDQTGKNTVLKSLQVSGGKNLDGSFKPSGYISVRLVLDAKENFVNAIKSTNCTIETYPKSIDIERANGFLCFEKWDKGERFVAVLTEAVFTTEQEKEEVANALPM